MGGEPKKAGDLRGLVAASRSPKPHTSLAVDMEADDLEGIAVMDGRSTYGDGVECEWTKVKDPSR
jgi:hypothetical protein